MAYGYYEEQIERRIKRLERMVLILSKLVCMPANIPSDRYVKHYGLKSKDLEFFRQSLNDIEEELK